MLGGGQLLPITFDETLFDFGGRKLSSVANGSASSDAAAFGQIPVGAAGVLYPKFTPSSDDDEFDDGSFTGWTAVNSGSHTVVVTEANSIASLAHPGGDVGGELHAWMKSHTFATDDWIEGAFRNIGRWQNYPIFGLIVADGATYGAGAQLITGPDIANAANAQGHLIFDWTNYNTQGSGTLYATSASPLMIGPLYFVRLQYKGANAWDFKVSSDGVGWTPLDGSSARSLAGVTHAGFFMASQGGANPWMVSCEYIKFGNG